MLVLLIEQMPLNRYGESIGQAFYYVECLERIEGCASQNEYVRVEYKKEEKNFPPGVRNLGNHNYREFSQRKKPRRNFERGQNIKKDLSIRSHQIYRQSYWKT